MLARKLLLGEVGSSRYCLAQDWKNPRDPCGDGKRASFNLKPPAEPPCHLNQGELT